MSRLSPKVIPALISYCLNVSFLASRMMLPVANCLNEPRLNKGRIKGLCYMPSAQECTQSA